MLGRLDAPVEGKVDTSIRCSDGLLRACPDRMNLLRSVLTAELHMQLLAEESVLVR